MWEEFQAVKESQHKVVHYQVINHELYRQEECMFGPRLIIVARREILLTVVYFLSQFQ